MLKSWRSRAVTRHEGEVPVRVCLVYISSVRSSGQMVKATSLDLSVVRKSSNAFVSCRIEFNLISIRVPPV